MSKLYDKKLKQILFHFLKYIAPNYNVIYAGNHSLLARQLLTSLSYSL